MLSTIDPPINSVTRAQYSTVTSEPFFGVWGVLKP